MIGELENKVIHGDCLEVMRDIPDGSIDLILTDPPYGHTDCEWDFVPTEDFFHSAMNKITQTGALVVFNNPPFTFDLSCIRKYFRHYIVWIKDKASNWITQNFMPLKQSELIFVFSKSGYPHSSNPKAYYESQKNEDAVFVGHENVTYETAMRSFTSFNHQIVNRPLTTNIKTIRHFVENGTDRHDGNIKASNCIYCPVPFGKNRFHATQKPALLCEYLIKTYCPIDGIVLDSFLGSGTTAVAAINTGRRFMGIEKNAKYCEIAQRRVTEAINAPRQLELVGVI